jgi:outer membrane protein OmpA-like peptidoglycan-associated protein
MTGFTGDLALGYALGNGWRFELEADVQRNQRGAEGNSAAVLRKTAFETKFGTMANAVFDFDIGSPYIFPYAGAGVGFQNLNGKITTSLVGGGSTSTNANAVDFATQAIGGVSFPIPGVVGLSVTADYRFLVVNNTQTYPGIETTSRNIVSHNLRVRDDHSHLATLGLRYAFNVAPVAGPAAPAAAPIVVKQIAPAPAPARSYLVFFDWDKADLTDRAQQIIAEAAKNAAKTGNTRIDVAGHADKSGAAAYNQSLSLARANNVAAELVRLGVAKMSIVITAFGDTKPLVPTATGVREPQNRRVEIVLK